MSRQRLAAAGAGHGDGTAPRVTPEIAAEAAVWVARLHGPARSRRMERECLDWQARSGAHRLAFERCTETWQDVPKVTLANAYAAAARGRRQARAPLRWALGIAGAALVVAVGLVADTYWHRAGAYDTRVGEQQVVVLEDGTRMSLNTNTHVRVELGARQRTVDVLGGEALFEVARDAQRPFVVHAAGSEVVALGTVFSVRLTADQGHAGDALAVTLIEGHVTLRPAPDAAADGLAPARPMQMQPGERVRLEPAPGGSAAAVEPLVDRPSIDQVMAWKRSEVAFDNTALAEAVAEMNRYNRTPIVLLGDRALADKRVSGLYRAGDSTGFARAVAALHGLALRERDGRLELSMTP